MILFEFRMAFLPSECCAIFLAFTKYVANIREHNTDKTHFGIFPVPVIHDDDPNNSRVARRLAWDGSRNSSTLAQLLGSGKGIHGYGSSGMLSLFIKLTYALN